jgi:hypothetical protein
MQLWWLGMMMVSAVFYYCSLNRERSSSKRGSAQLKEWLPRAVITNLLASGPRPVNDFRRDPVFMFWISELSDLIAGVKRRIASVGLNTSDCLLLFEDVAGFQHQIYYLFIYLFSHSPFLFSQVYVPSRPEGRSNIITCSHSFICVFHMFCRFYVIAFSFCCCFLLCIFFVIVMLATRSDKWYEMEKRVRILSLCLLYNSVTSMNNMNSNWL